MELANRFPCVSVVAANSTLRKRTSSQVRRFPLGIMSTADSVPPAFLLLRYIPLHLNAAGGVIKFYDIDVDVSNSNTFDGPNETDR